MRPIAILAAFAASIGTSQSGTQESVPLRVALAEINRKADVYAASIGFLAEAKVPSPPIQEIDDKNVEQHLTRLVKSLPVPSRLIKLYLPEGPRWTGEELLAYVQAEAKLFRRPVKDSVDGNMEVLGKPVASESRTVVADALSLRPVYVIALKSASFGGYWETTYGVMRLEQKGDVVTGTYSANEGEIRGKVVGMELRFNWYEQRTNGGGPGVVTMSDDGLSFSGPWWNGSSSDPAGTWSGKRMLGR